MIALGVVTRFPREPHGVDAPAPFHPTASAPPALRAGDRRKSFRDASNPADRRSPALAALPVKSRRPDWSKNQPSNAFRCGAVASLCAPLYVLRGLGQFLLSAFLIAASPRFG